MNKTADGNQTVFYGFLPESVIDEARDPVAQRLLREYGSVFIARGGVSPPDRILFRNEQDVERFQRAVEIGKVEFGDLVIELQASAAASLQAAINEAASNGLSISPRGPDSGRRSYLDTISLWQSRVDPALDHWVGLNRIDASTAKFIRSLPAFEQVPEIFELESREIYFAKDLSKSIIYSVAPPGTSQHLSMLAFDIAEYNNPMVRKILARHQWYQTVTSDLPHFTYLGIAEADLATYGLRQVNYLDRGFWIPDI